MPNTVQEKRENSRYKRNQVLNCGLRQETIYYLKATTVYIKLLAEPARNQCHQSGPLGPRTMEGSSSDFCRVVELFLTPVVRPMVSSANYFCLGYPQRQKPALEERFWGAFKKVTHNSKCVLGHFSSRAPSGLWWVGKRWGEEDTHIFAVGHAISRPGSEHLVIWLAVILASWEENFTIPRNVAKIWGCRRNSHHLTEWYLQMIYQVSMIRILRSSCVNRTYLFLRRRGRQFQLFSPHILQLSPAPQNLFQKVPKTSGADFWMIVRGRRKGEKPCPALPAELSIQPQMYSIINYQSFHDIILENHPMSIQNSPALNTGSWKLAGPPPSVQTQSSASVSRGGPIGRATSQWS